MDGSKWWGFDAAVVVDGAGAAGAVEVDGEGIEAGGVGVDAFSLAVGEGGGGEALEFGGFEGFGGEASAAPAGAHFDEDEGGAIAREEVDFVAADAEVAGKDGVAGGLEVVGGEAFAEGAEALTRGYHGRACWATGA